MGVYIKDMEMPGCCAECEFCGGFSVESGDYICDCVEDLYTPDDIVMDGRPDWCPLVEVPTPHGRLIDADALADDLQTDGEQYGEDLKLNCASWLRSRQTPTIIEAEE